MSRILLQANTRRHDLWWVQDDEQTFQRNVVVSPTIVQAETTLSTAAFNMEVGGWKCGKTSWGPIWSFDQMSRFSGEDFLITAPTYSAMNDIIVPLITTFANNTRFKGEFRKNDMTYYTPYGAIFFKSAQTPEHLQGRHVCGAWCDEIAQYALLAWKHIKSRIDIEGGRLLGTTTPYGMNWFYDDLYQKFLEGNPDYRFWRLLSIDNPSYDRSVWYRDLLDMSKDEFMMFHMGLFRRRMGLVYPDFSRDRHVGEVSLDNRYPCVAGMDFGWGDNTVFKIGQHIPADPGTKQKEQWLFPEEYVESNTTTQSHAKALAPLVEKYAVRRVFYDYHGAQTAADLDEELKTKYHLTLDWVPVTEPIKPGWEEVTRLLRNDAILESPGNDSTLDEYATYVIAKNGQPEAREHNHCMDAVRYMVEGNKFYEDIVETINNGVESLIHKKQMSEAERHMHEVAGDIDQYDLEDAGEYDALGAF